MRLRRLREPELLLAIRKDFLTKKGPIILGIGDDAAVLKPGKNLLVVTKDLLIEKTHFRREINPPYFLGRKSLSVNLSDLAAMGGRPLYCLLGLGLPPSLPPSWVEEFMAGLKAICQRERVSLVGGDLSRSPEIVISITVIGQVKRFVPRNGAKPGDTIWLSGYPGLAAAGLWLLEKTNKLAKEIIDKIKAGRLNSIDPLIGAFLDPSPQLRLGCWLARHGLASAMIDTSDGLSIDLCHLCEESQVGAEIEQSRIPLHPALKENFSDFWSFVLAGGEDYQLLFTVPPHKRNKIVKVSRRFNLHEIGRIIKSRQLWIIDNKGERRPLKPAGFSHFNP
ncbi:MAG: thiamine-phosphate kinase [Candidatus Aminicenantes bacterium]|nr:thiamine-phosphate kinase [Candidatus Aminicenantes bacterium]